MTKNLLAQSSGGAVKSEIMPKQKLTEELHKPIIQGGDLADTRLINLSLIYYVLLIFIANMHGSITKVFQEIIYEPWRKPIKIWVDQGSEFYKAHFAFL